MSMSSTFVRPSVGAVDVVVDEVFEGNVLFAGDVFETFVLAVVFVFIATVVLAAFDSADLPMKYRPTTDKVPQPMTTTPRISTTHSHAFEDFFGAAPYCCGAVFHAGCCDCIVGGACMAARGSVAGGWFMKTVGGASVPPPC